MVNIYAIWIEIENVQLHLWKKSNIKDAFCEKLDKKVYCCQYAKLVMQTRVREINPLFSLKLFLLS